MRFKTGFSVSKLRAFAFWPVSNSYSCSSLHSDLSTLWNTLQSGGILNYIALPQAYKGNIYAATSFRLTVLYEDKPDYKDPNSEKGNRLFIWVDDKVDKAVALPLAASMNRLTIQEHPSNHANYSPGTAHFNLIDGTS